MTNHSPNRCLICPDSPEAGCQCSNCRKPTLEQMRSLNEQLRAEKARLRKQLREYVPPEPDELAGASHD